MTNLYFDCTNEEFDLALSIVERGQSLRLKLGYDSFITMPAVMDIIACHKNGCPLKLQELYEASDGNFSHDFFGIRQHIDRETGKLTDGFTPRYAVTEWDTMPEKKIIHPKPKMSGEGEMPSEALDHHVDYTFRKPDGSRYAWAGFRKVRSIFGGNPPDAGSLFVGEQRIAWLPADYAMEPKRLKRFIQPIFDAWHDKGGTYILSRGEVQLIIDEAKAR